MLLNGTNGDRESQALYAAWMKRHQGTDAISGSPTADRRAAVVEAFRDDKDIMIATESGAEGINLQFCSLVVNFDLPWNPQRVEQRIGRCHRYGQKIDVTVVSFLNLRNHAEQRIYQLLDQKFRLFDGVFGASDEVLGAIESGVDFERRVLEIVQSARSESEINQEFDRLQTELQGQIDTFVLDARKRLLDRVDEDVVRRLKTRKGEINQVMHAFEQRLLTLARAELPGPRFTPTTRAGSITTARPGRRNGRWPTRRTGSSSAWPRALSHTAWRRRPAPGTCRWRRCASIRKPMPAGG